ncbi:MAG: hypothetical protein WA919_28685 [Coleofasciculaceae cyanobacterium]
MIWQNLKHKYVLICGIGIWALAANGLQAQTNNLSSLQTVEYSKVFQKLDFSTDSKRVSSSFGEISSNLNSELASQPPPIAKLDTLNQLPDGNTEIHSVELPDSLESPPILLAAPENFNPGLRLPTELPQQSPEPSSTEPLRPAFLLESITTEFRNDRDNFDQSNQFIEETAKFRLRNGNVFTVKTGFNSFEDSEVDSVTNTPIQIGWEGKIDQVTLELAGGVDLFDRLPAALKLKARAEVPLGVNLTPEGELQSGVFLSAVVEQGPYKFSAETLDNQITAWRFGPNIYWQIDRNTSFFALVRLGFYNDDNREWQSFSRLERKLGQFSIAANLFTWNYQENLETESGYFSPPDFLVYNAEVAWQRDVFDFLNCRLAATLGRQRLEGNFDNASSYQALCTAKLSPSVEADLGYTYTNVLNQDSGDSGYNNQSFKGQLRFKF